MTLEELFQDHHASLFRFVSRMTYDPDLAKDIVQETFLHLAERWSPSDPPTRAWLFQVASNLTRSRLRKKRRRLRLLADGRHRVPTARAVIPPDTQAERAEVRAVVREALAGLSERERTILLMREEGFTHREIAGTVGTTTGSVGTMLARALDKLADRLDGLKETSP